MMSDLREAGGIEQDANMIFMLYRDDYYNRELADDDTGKSDIELNVAKNKDGETGVVELQFFKNTEVLLMIIAELQQTLGVMYREVYKDEPLIRELILEMGWAIDRLLKKMRSSCLMNTKMYVK